MTDCPKTTTQLRDFPKFDAKQLRTLFSLVGAVWSVRTTADRRLTNTFDRISNSKQLLGVYLNFRRFAHGRFLLFSLVPSRSASLSVSLVGDPPSYLWNSGFVCRVLWERWFTCGSVCVRTVLRFNWRWLGTYMVYGRRFYGKVRWEFFCGSLAVFWKSSLLIWMVIGVFRVLAYFTAIYL